MIGIFGSIQKTSCASIQLTEPHVYFNDNCSLNNSSLCQKLYTDRLFRLGSSVFGGNYVLTGDYQTLEFRLNNPNVVFEQYFSTGNSTWSYSTESGTPNNRKVKKGFNDNTWSIPDMYYVYDIHSNYPNRNNISMKMPFDTSNIINQNFDSSSLTLKDKIISYHFDFMVGAVSVPFITSQTTDINDFCNSFLDLSTMEIDTGAQYYCQKWIESYNKYSDTTNYPTTDVDYLGDIRYFHDSNVWGAELLDYLYSNSPYFPTFQSNSRPFYNLLNTYTYTYYNLITTKGYFVNLNTGSPGESINVYPDMRLVTSSGDVNIYCSCILQLVPIYYEYVENGIPYRAYCIALRLSFYGLIPDNTSFTDVKCRFWLKYQLPVDTSAYILDTFLFPYNYSISSNDAFIPDDGTNDVIYQFLNSIPLIGTYLAQFYLIFVSLFQFILSFIASFILLPPWFIGGIWIIFVALLVRIIFKLVRG